MAILRHLVQRSRSVQTCSFSSTCRLRGQIVKENDIVLLQSINDDKTVLLTERLKLGAKPTKTFNYDSVSADQIIGKKWRDIAQSKKRARFRILQPTLGQYTNHSSRLVTPIYSQDCNLIVSLLDLHPSTPGEVSGDENGKEERLEIFEAGTGHGALTLHLARAIHAANTHPPVEQEQNAVDSEDGVSDDGVSGRRGERAETEKPFPTTMKAWRSNRRAVIHTLDISAKYSAHAEQVIKGFRKGMYYPHIDFHVGNIDEYLSSRLVESANEPFLGHAILDLPSTLDFFHIVGKSLKPEGKLITFCPSITQINECLMHAKTEGMPFFLEQTLEIGGAVGVGGREWDVRPVKPRALMKAEAAAALAEETAPLESEAEDIELPSKPEVIATTETFDPKGWSMICRPRVGTRTVGGGFVGVWRKTV